MKLLMIMLIVLVLVLFGCQSNSKIKLGDPMDKINNKYSAFISLNSLFVFQTNDVYTVVIENDERVDKIVQFFSNRKSHNVNGLFLVDAGDINDCLGKTIDEIEKKFGSPHADIGSGFYIPAYITEDAYLVYFEMSDGKVSNIVKMDLLRERDTGYGSVCPSETEK